MNIKKSYSVQIKNTIVPGFFRLKRILVLAVIVASTSVLSIKANGQNVISTYAGDGISGYTIGTGGAATSSELSFPKGVALDAAGNLYITDGNSVVKKVTPSGVITNFAGTPGSAGFSGDGGAATSAQLNEPAGIAVDASGNVYIADAVNDRIRKVNSAGIISTVAGTTAGYSGDGGAATSAQLNQPIGLAVDASGNIYIGDFTNNVIRKVTVATGNISTVAGNHALGAGYTDGVLATSGQINGPHGLAVDAAGNILIADQGNNVIRIVLASNDSIFTFAGDGIPTYTGDGGYASAATLNFPSGIAVNSLGYVFIVDDGNDVIRIVSPTGIISTYAGNGTTGYSGDGGPATSAEFDFPQYIAVNNTTGSTYISDASNYVVREVSLAHGIYFTNPANDSIEICKNTTNISLDSLIAVTDTTAGDTVTWINYPSSGYGPYHGTLSDTTYAETATGGSILPSGFLYTPNPGYQGYDTIFVQATNNHVVTQQGFIIKIDQSYATTVGGSYQVCVGSGGTFTDTISGGVWSATNADATINATTGFITGVSAGIDTIVYTITNACGVATQSSIFTVKDTTSLAPITGPTTVSAGATINLSNDSTGGTWTATNSNAIINSTSGLVTGETPGTDTIKYKKTGSCNTATALYVITVTTELSPGTITGSSTLCTGTTTVLRDTTASVSGTWSSSNNSRATISSGGTVRGISGGNDTIRYVVTSGSVHDTAFFPITVIASPTVAAVSPGGTSLICATATLSLTDATTGGTWTTTNAALATVSTIGVVTGIAGGTDTIKYTVTNTCGSTSAIKRVTVRALANSGTITGGDSVCAGATTSLADAAFGGTWSTTNSAIATVGTSGIVTGITSGTVTVEYKVTNTCGTDSATHIMTVDPLPVAGTITGPSTVCAGSTIMLSDTTAGGFWADSSGLASVTSTGVVTGISAGSDDIVYLVNNSCGTDTARHSITIQSTGTVNGINGLGYVCQGSSITLSDATTGGTWSANNGDATVSTSGVVSGITAGVDTIYYGVSGTCGSAITAFPITVVANPVVSVTAAADTICTGTSVMLSGTTTATATSVNLLPLNSFENGVPGAGWNELGPNNNFLSQVDAASSSTPAISAAEDGTYFLKWDGWDAPAGDSAAIYSPSFSMSGIVNGAVTFWVYRDVSGYTGSAYANEGFRVYVNTSAAVGGTVLGFVPRDAASAVSGANISGTSITVAPGWYQYTCTLPSSYTGSTNYILFSAVSEFGDNCYLDNISVTGQLPASGLTWSPATYLYSDSGHTTPYVAGTSQDTVYAHPVGITSATNLTYVATAANGSCSATGSNTITVNPAFSPSSIGGSSTVCAGSSITLTDSVSGGTWTAANGNATVSSTGIVTGVTAGTDTISYAESGACGSGTATRLVTVTTTPVSAPITGTFTVCAGATTTLGDATTGGVWSSSSTAIATVSSGGAVRGIVSGTSLISYVVTNTCGAITDTATVTVAPLPSAGIITGIDSVCQGSSVTLTDTTSGGSWISTSNAIASVGATTGIVTGVAPGTVTIRYAVTNSCGTNNTGVTFKVNATPNAGTIAGAGSVCEGSSISLTDAASGGVWSSSNTAIATVSTTGSVTGISPGADTIVYRVTNSCGTASATATVNVNPVPNAGSIFGSTNICSGGSVTLTEDSAGGVWSSANPSIATVNAATGQVQGISAGTATISYSITSLGCTGAATTTVPVGVPAIVPAIGGASSVCLGASTTLTDSLTGGVWTSSNTTIATVDPSTGIVSGINAGTATITYTGTNSCGSGYNTKSILVKDVSSASAISGATNLCQGDVTVLSDAVSGGVWAISNSSLATVNASTGQVTTLAAGTDTVSYSVTNPSGCVTTATAAVTINPVPVVSPVSGSSSICTGITTAFTDTTTGGVWSSSNTGVANVNSAGIVLGTGAGTATISYSVTNGGGCSAAATYTVTVHAGPVVAPISGATSLCAGNNTLLTDAAAGGVWTTSNSAIASITSAGTLTGVMAGTVMVTYSVTNTSGCSSTSNETFTVNPIPAGGTITGPAAVCIGSNITLSDAAGGGVWVSSNPAIAAIDSVTGVLTPLAAPGFVTVTYSVTNVCGTATATTGITLNPLPVAGTINGPGTVCPGNTIALTDSVTGGMWSSSNAALASVDAAGNVTGTGGTGSGSVVITYAVTTVCGTATAADSIAVNPTPQPITGITTVCAGQATTLFDATTGGDWVSANPLIANVNTTTGVVGGIAAGSTMISYNAGSGCTNFVSTTVTVNALPSVSTITGPTSLCAMAAISLGDATTGGVWSTTDTTIATVNSAGIVTGIAAGTTEVAYTVTSDSGCSNAANKIITVNAITVLSPISGTTSLCVGSSSVLTDTAAGGTWTSSDDAIAYIDPVTGDLLAESAGTATIMYSATNPSGCVSVATATVTVNAIPVLSALTGTDSVCVGATTTLSNSTTGGVWSSSDSAVATVSAAGVVTGISGGTAAIGYTVTNGSGCTNTSSVDINVKALPAPGPVSGITSLCQGTDVLLSDTASGGVWSSSNDTIATVNSAGVVIGLAAGTATITYTLGNSCATALVMDTVTVHAIPSVSGISGRTSVCAGSIVSLGESTTGGLWSASNTNATVDSAGLLTGHTAGIDTITYQVTNAAGCFTSVTVVDTINAVPVVPALSGPATVCAGSTITLTDGVAGGIWSSSNAAASVDTTGRVTGNTAGTDTITYTVVNTAGCATSVTSVITINALPAVSSLGGTATICTSATLALSDSAAGGVWSSSNASASVSDSGLVTGNIAGTDTISYAVTNSCGTAISTLVLTVNPSPVSSPVLGVSSLCAGATDTLTNDSTGGLWIASNAHAAITASGVITGNTAGIDTISYVMGNSFGCITIDTSVITVNAIPAATTITGSTGICLGAVATLTDITAGGVWSSSNDLVASVDTAGHISGTGAGSAVISYSISNICGASVATHTVTVSPIPSIGAISGTVASCSGSPDLLTDTTAGGVWSSSNTSVATVNSLGIVTGIATGIATITYDVTNSGGCSAQATFTVNIGASIPGLTLVPVGGATLCHGSPVNMEVAPLSSGLSYQWMINGDAIAGATSSGYTTDTIGIYSVMVNNGTCSEVVGATHVVLPPNPVVALNTSSNVLFTGSFATYQWYFDSSVVIGATSSILPSDGVGSYFVVVSDANGCYDSSAVYVIAPPAGVNNVVGIADVKVYPNPAISMIQVTASVKVNVIILSLDGKVVIEQKDASSIDVSRLADAMYIIKVYDQENNLLKTDKFAKVQ
jgi:uncharacterized protein YjdB